MANRGRPKKDYSYNRAWVRTANERLRKMENKNGKGFSLTLHGNDKDINIPLKNLSWEYKQIERYADQTNGKGQIYKRTADGGIRFINKTEYEQLSEEGKKYFNERLEKFLEAKTSMKTGIINSYQKAYETFKEKYPAYENISFEDYMKMWKEFNDKVLPDAKNHFNYDRFTQMLEQGDLSYESLTGNQADAVKRYLLGKANKYKNSGHIYRNHNKQGKYADRAPRRPNRYI